MDSTTWEAVDGYYADVLNIEDSALNEAVARSAAAGLPAIQVSPALGRLLYLIARMHHAKRILEVGTLGGYSTIHLARALGDTGELISLELDAKHAAVAQENVDAAGLTEKVTIEIGPALASMDALIGQKAGPFDLFFIDADKENIPHYVEKAIALARSGSVIIVDNVVRDGAVLNAQSDDASVQGIRALNGMLSKDHRLEATALQTVGCKGYDGFLLAIVK